MKALANALALVMTLTLVACMGGSLGAQQKINVSYSKKPAAPVVMPDRQPKVVFTSDETSFYLDEQGKPTAWGRETCVPEDLDQVVSIATHPAWSNAAIRHDGAVVIWGCREVIRTLIPEDLRNVKALAMGDTHALALKDDGSVVGWGTGPGVSEMPSDLKDVIAISAGEHHGLALHQNGTVTAWDGSAVRPDFPQLDLTGVVAIASGDDHNLALRNDGTVVVWGSEDFFPAIPPGLTDDHGAIAIAIGGKNYYVLLADGSLRSWRWEPAASVKNLATVRDAIDITAGYDHGLVQKRDGTLASWGSGISSLLPSDLAAGVASVAPDLSLLLKADGEIIPRIREVLLSNDAPVVRVDADGGLAVAYHEGGALSFWGAFFEGEGVDPVQQSFDDIKEVALAESRSAVFLKTDGTVFIQQNSVHQNEVDFVESLRDITSVKYAAGYFVALNKYGELIAWRGLHSAAPDSELQVFNGPLQIQAIGGGYFRVLIQRRNGTVATWDPKSSSVVEAFAGESDIVRIMAGYPSNLAVKRNGTVVAETVHLPDGFSLPERIPQIPQGLTDVVGLYSGQPPVAATRNGQIIIWGEMRLPLEFYQLPE